MDNETLQAVVNEILPILAQKRIGKIFQLARYRLAIDFRPGDGRYLFLNFDPSTAPRLYLIRRRVRELEKQSELSSNFVLFARKRLANAQLFRIGKDENDRIVRFHFLGETETGDIEGYALIAQLAGRSANLFLLDSENTILESLRETSGAGQEIGQTYSPPFRETSFDAETLRRGDGEKKSLLEEIEIKLAAFPPRDVSAFQLDPPSPLSERLDYYFSQIESERDFQTLVKSAESGLRQELNKKEKLLQRLEYDLKRHGEPEDLKKRGDLLLANVATARRAGNKVYVTDFFDENAPEIEIEADENLSLPEAAEKFFARYAKARNAATELTGRIEKLYSEIADLKEKQLEFEQIIARRDENALTEFLETNKFAGAKPLQKAEQKTNKAKEPENVPGARRYRSSDGYEILVGRASKDNDYITFRVAKSLDWWLHTADYPGSHVVVRNPKRGEDLPPRTLIEAAELAAKFSRAGQAGKVAVNYTLRKFVTKPKNAAPGLVRLASFKTIMVEPKESGTRI